MWKKLALGIICMSLTLAFDLTDLQGDLNVLETFGISPKVENGAKTFIRLQKNYNNTNAHYWKRPIRLITLKSFVFECIFRIDKDIANNLNKNEFILFALENVPNSKNVFEIGISNERSLKFNIKSENHNDSTITFDQVMPENWHKLILSYQNGKIEYWFDCMSKQKASQIYPVEMAVHYYREEEYFQFSVGFFKDLNKNIGRNFGNFDIKKMKFYTGYLRPLELECCDVPNACHL